MTRDIFFSRGEVRNRLYFAGNYVDRRKRSNRIATGVGAERKNLRLLVRFSDPAFYLFRVRIFRPRAFYREAATSARRRLLHCRATASFHVLVESGDDSFRLQRTSGFHAGRRFGTSLYVFHARRD